MNFFDLPKIDLHCHLDGSVRPQTVMDIAHQQGLTIPSADINEITSLMIAPETCQSLDEYLKRFELPLSVMQTQANIERISFELFEDAARENIKYLEVRFAPLFHLQNGLTLEQVIASAIDGMNKAEKKFDIKGNFILSVMRAMPKHGINELIDIGAKYLNKGVVAFDIAGSEHSGFCQEFVPHVQYAMTKGYQITVHAGEQGDGQNVYDAVSLLGAKRIGHGIGINEHSNAYNLVKHEAVVLETCPSSNIQTKAVSDLSQHPINKFYKDGVLVTINTDNRTVSNTTMTEEVGKVIEEFNLSRNDYFEIYKVSIEHSFACEAVKQYLLTFLKSAKI
jgi:adenosine deaminase